MLADVGDIKVVLLSSASRASPSIFMPFQLSDCWRHEIPEVNVQSFAYDMQRASVWAGG